MPAKKIAKTAVKKTVNTAKKAVKKDSRLPVPTKGKPKVVAVAAKPAGKKKGLSKNDSKVFRAMLVRLREQLTGQISALKDDSLRREDPVDLAEDGSDAFERQFALNLVSAEQDSIFEIDEAMRRIEDGSYGICEECSAAIELGRLKALPFARMCVKCRSEQEKNKSRPRAL